MKLEHAKDIVRSADNMGLEVTLRENYSGRGISGVVGKLGEIVQAIAATAADLAENEPDSLDGFLEDVNISIDNMGRQVIVY